MRTPIFLTLAAVACLTVTISFVRASGITFGTNRHGDTVEAEFRRAWKENKQDEASREKLAWLCCETKRYDDARKILTDLHQRRGAEADQKYSAAYSADFAKVARVEICAAKFDAALRLYQAQLDYDKRFLGDASQEVARDRNNIALAETLLGQTKSDVDERDKLLTSASESSTQAAAHASPDQFRQLQIKENQLLLAQARGNREQAKRYKQELHNLRESMKLKVPLVDF